MTDWYKKCASSALGYGYGAAFDSDRARTVFFGGGLWPFPGFPSRPTNTQEWYDGAMHDVAPATTPPERVGCGFAYDQARQLTNMYGGFASSGIFLDGYDDHWQYDGSDWTQIFPSTTPGARGGVGMAYDAANSQIVLFGGLNDDSPVQETWVFDGTDWSQLAPADQPSARVDGCPMAWDPVNGNIVLFGGGPSNAGLGDTWLWDGTNWAEQSPAHSPPARRYGALAGIAGIGVVLYGTYDGALRGDTWLWDGSDWAQSTTAHHPTFPPHFAQLTDYLGEAPGGEPVFVVNGEVWTWTPPPAATTDPASGVTSGGDATLNGTVTPNNEDGATTEVWFDYGPDLGYGTSIDIGPFTGASPTAVDTVLAGLAAGSYHFRVRAIETGGCEYLGGDMTFVVEDTTSDPTLNCEFAL